MKTFLKTFALFLFAAALITAGVLVKETRLLLGIAGPILIALFWEMFEEIPEEEVPRADFLLYDVE